MYIPLYKTSSPIVVSSIAERDDLLNDTRYRISGLSVKVDDVIYWLNSDLQSWSPQGTFAASNGELATTYSPIGGSSSDTLRLRDTLLEAAANGTAVQLIGTRAIQLLYDGVPGNNVPTNTRLTCAQGTQIELNQPSSFIFYSKNDNEIPLGTHAATQTVSNIIIPSTLSQVPVVGQSLLVRFSDAGGLYDVKSIGEAVIGTASISTSSLYGGSSTLDGLTLILNVDGAGAQTLTLNKATNVASKSAFLAAIAAKWTTLNLVVSDSKNSKLVMSAPVSLVVGSGTANTLLGLTDGANTNISIVTDRPIVWPFAIGTSSIDLIVNPQHDISIDMRGALLQGCAGQIFEAKCCRRYSVRNVHHIYRASDPNSPLGITQVIGLDVGTRESEMVGICCRNENVGNANGYAGVWMQANERCIIRDSRLEGFSAVGYNMADSYNCQSINNWTIQCGYAHMVSGDFSNETFFGCIDCGIEGGGDIGSTIGLYIVGAIRTKVSNFSSIGAKDTGVSIAHFTGFNTTSTTLTGCSFADSPIGVTIGGSVYGTKFFGLNTDGCKIGIEASQELEVHGWDMSTTVVGEFPYMAIINGPGPYLFNGFNIQNTNPNGNGFSFGGTGYVRVINGRIAAGSGGIGITLNSEANIYVDNVIFIGNYGLVANSGTITVGPNCDFSACTNGAFYPGAGTIIWIQKPKISQLNVTGYPALGMTFAQVMNSTIELTGVMGADTWLNCPSYKGLQWTIYNNTTGAHTLTFKEFPVIGSGVVVAQGKSAVVRVNSAGAIVRVTADT